MAAFENIGKSATEELKEFLGVFQPLSAKGAEGTKMRKAYFTYADPNGNGLCSLAEIENFIMVSLTKKFPKNNKKKNDKGDPEEHGRDLFDLFRPCYIRAFNDAKDIMDTKDGKVLEGTKNATADDFVSWGEFRYMNVFLCYYGAMYDAFSQIDGGSAGREGDDLRIDKSEWMSAYKKVNNYGFVALDAIKTDAQATKAFGEIDDNGGGFILFDELSEWIKKKEIGGGTEMGSNLAFEEPGRAAAEPAPKKKGAAKKGAKKGGKIDPWPKVLAWFRKKKERAGQLKQMFKDLDTDGSGDLDIEELVDGMKKMGLVLSEEEWPAYFEALDANGDKKITLAEFTKAIRAAIAADNKKK